jgi:hypothetical protein
LNLRPPGPEPGALARLRYAPTVCCGEKISLSYLRSCRNPKGGLRFHLWLPFFRSASADPLPNLVDRLEQRGGLKRLARGLHGIVFGAFG